MTPKLCSVLPLNLSRISLITRIIPAAGFLPTATADHLDPTSLVLRL